MRSIGILARSRYGPRGTAFPLSTRLWKSGRAPIGARATVLAFPYELSDLATLQRVEAEKLAEIVRVVLVQSEERRLVVACRGDKVHRACLPC